MGRRSKGSGKSSGKAGERRIGATPGRRFRATMSRAGTAKSPTTSDATAGAAEVPAVSRAVVADRREPVRSEPSLPVIPEPRGETVFVRGAARQKSTANDQPPATNHKRPPANAALLSSLDVHLFNEGTHLNLYEKMGAHPQTRDGAGGVSFAVWAPAGIHVAVIGDFNGWDPSKHPLSRREESGIWEGFIPGLGIGAVYKYHIVSQNGYRVAKADPFGFKHENPPRTASIVASLDYEWGDGGWMSRRGGGNINALRAPISIYEMHIGSWRRHDGQAYGYRELAPILTEYLQKLGFTHVELMPVMEHPFYGSWGYQVTGYYAVTSRYGTPTDLMYLIDYLHQHELGVILDWVPSHFPSDEHGLSYFDGTHLFEHEDPRQGFHPDWGSLIFNYGRNEVRSFLLSNAMFWLDRFHADALRVDAVASMLYLDYSRKAGQWVPNVHGGKENIDAISFLRRLNEEVYRTHPDVQMIAEESTSWPMVSRPIYLGGLGFGLKWDMGWMHDTLEYMTHDPIHRRFHHSKLTFRTIYAWSENFVLPLSHDEVVHGKGSLLEKMPGDGWRKFANLRLLYGWMFAQPGKKMIFMGGEFGQRREWNHDEALDWHLLERPEHAGLQRWVADLNRLYRNSPALHARDFEHEGFEWIDCCDSDQSVVSLLRRGDNEKETTVAVFNFTPEPRYNYQIGVPTAGYWKEVLNSDGADYWGSGQGNLGGVESAPIALHGRPHALTLTLPPLGAVFFQLDEKRSEER